MPVYAIVFQVSIIDISEIGCTRNQHITQYIIPILNKTTIL